MTARSTTVAVLALGSNLGDREAILRAAVRDIAAVAGVEVTAASGFVETPALKPEGISSDAPTYLNAVITVHTMLAPEELLHAVNAIEAHHGRVREARWGDRTLDIELTVPHPRAATRAFVLVPWLQVDPDASIPGLGRIDALLEGSRDSATVYPARPLMEPAHEQSHPEQFHAERP
jgi:2-amino-4-hydroxy-6-hydroxymethyldihydropteridine diphosphokinase